MDPTATDKNFLDEFDWATREIRLCPNRLWSVTGMDMLKVIPNRKALEGHGGSTVTYHDHEMCTLEFCEFSQRDFTAVQQRHECKGHDCFLLQDLFSRETLRKAAEKDTSTVWSLDGLSMLEHPRPHMAVSHVWSDGTGTGAWADGEVNGCLYGFFRRIALQFQCEGIWWDTICIPKEKAARNRAIRKIQSNYETARITLVHDRFLRNWNWDPKTACFAILMSPWFSRGWTALELAKSRKVKVIFQGRCGLLIKDLDEEILLHDDDSSNDDPRMVASRIIKDLRKPITSCWLVSSKPIGHAQG
ncbi:hypothetical protein GGR54DRAFT_630991 [Hypoxylon sp. NC1633]|nr:hypothetical protein GGR54DRAFT_630991 [Hypoxylon sp. NC1633]